MKKTIHTIEYEVDGRTTTVGRFPSEGFAQDTVTRLINGIDPAGYGISAVNNPRVKEIPNPPRSNNRPSFWH